MDFIARTGRAGPAPRFSPGAKTLARRVRAAPLRGVGGLQKDSRLTAAVFRCRFSAGLLGHVDNDAGAHGAAVPHAAGRAGAPLDFIARTGRAGPAPRFSPGAKTLARRVRAAPLRGVGGLQKDSRLTAAVFRCRFSAGLLGHVDNDAGTHGAAALADGEAQALLDGDGGDQFHVHVHVIAGHTHLDRKSTRLNSSHWS